MSAENVSKLPLNNQLKIPTFRELIKSIPTIRSTWRLRTPLQKWCYLYGIGKAILHPTDHPFFKDDQTLSTFIYISIVPMAVYTILAIYTIFYYIANGEPAKCLPCTCLLTLGLATYILTWLGVSKKRHLAHNLLSFAGHYIYPDKHDDIEYTRICSKHIDTSVKSYLTKTAMLFLTMNLSVSGIYVPAIIQHVRATTTELKVPFTEEKSNAEFLINMIITVFFASHGGLIYLGMEAMMSVWCDIVTISPKLIKYEFQKLYDKIQEKDFTKQKLRITFLNIVKQIVDTDEYTTRLTDALYHRTLLTPFLLTYSMAMSILSHYTMKFTAGYGMALMSYVQFFYMCDFAEQVEDNGMSEALYNSNWYALPIKYQRDMLYLMRNNQNSSKLTIGPFGPINRELYKITVKRTYSSVMYLLNFW